MNSGIPLGEAKSWPTVTREEFERIMDQFDYKRAGWGDCIEYRERYTDRMLGYEWSGGCRVHPNIDRGDQ